MQHFATLFVYFCTVLPTSAFAYIGPGLGAGTIGVILGVLGSIVLAIFAIFWYPIKRLFKKGKKTEKTFTQQVEPIDDNQKPVEQAETDTERTS